MPPLNDDGGAAGGSKPVSNNSNNNPAASSGSSSNNPAAGSSGGSGSAARTTLKVWGSRGSIPRSEPTMTRYGGATSCVELLSARGTRVILDMGSGSYSLGQHLVGKFFSGGDRDPETKNPIPGRGKEYYSGGSILITHTHWDHIQGFPFFVPLFIPGMQWDVYGPRGAAGSIRESLAGQMQYDYFPVNLDYLGAKISYHDLTEGLFYLGGDQGGGVFGPGGAVDPTEKEREEGRKEEDQQERARPPNSNSSPAAGAATTEERYCQEIGGDVKVTTHYLHHPCLTLGYRLTDATTNVTVCYITDHEPYDMRMGTEGYKPSSSLSKRNADDRHVDFIRGADLLIHDTQYTAAEYDKKVTWGHSTMEYVVDVALAAGVSKLAIFHHDPMRTDEQIDDMVEEARRRVAESKLGDEDGKTRTQQLEVFAAFDRQELELEGRPDDDDNDDGGAADDVTAELEDSTNLEEEEEEKEKAAADDDRDGTSNKSAINGSQNKSGELINDDDEYEKAVASQNAIEDHTAFATGGGAIMLLFSDQKEAKPIAEQMKNGHDCRVYTSVEEAVSAAEHIHPSVMLIQQELRRGEPTEDGVEVCRRIRSMGDWGETVPILVETSSQELLEQIRERGDGAGVTDWVSKPYSPEYVRTKLTIAMTRVGKIRWKKADLPPDEVERLGSLRAIGVLDTEREDRYDRLTRIAARAFDVPMAVVSLVDAHRQWFKSCEGLCASETSRDAAFCAHAILREEVFLIRDALLDDRFADNPLVTGGPHVRFYAGVPLCIGPKKHRVGTLCLIDQRPRDLDEGGLKMLKDLGALVEQELEQSLAIEKEKFAAAVEEAKRTNSSTETTTTNSSVAHSKEKAANADGSKDTQRGAAGTVASGKESKTCGGGCAIL